MSDEAADQWTINEDDLCYVDILNSYVRRLTPLAKTAEELAVIADAWRALDNLGKGLQTSGLLVLSLKYEHNYDSVSVSIEVSEKSVELSSFRIQDSDSSAQIHVILSSDIEFDEYEFFEWQNLFEELIGMDNCKLDTTREI